MKKYHALMFSLVMILALGLSACERSASTPLPNGTDFPIPGTTSPMDELNNIATLTAAASGSSINVDGATPTVALEEPKPTATTQPSDSQPTAVPPTSAPAGEVSTYPNPDTYTLKSGEFPYCIARRFNIAPSALLNANNLANASLVYPGTVLTIPKNAPVYNVGARALRAHPTSYVVQAGDTVYAIACLFGDVDPRNIEAVNNFTGSYSLNVGQTIQIP